MQPHKETSLFFKISLQNTLHKQQETQRKTHRALMACLPGSVNTAFMLGRTDHTNA